MKLGVAESDDMESIVAGSGAVIAGSMGVWGWMMSHVEYGVRSLDGVIRQRMGARGA